MPCGLKRLASVIIVSGKLGKRKTFAIKKVGKNKKWADCIGKKIVRLLDDACL